MGLENFAQPLAAKQARFDQVFDAVDAAKFDIQGLGADKESAEKLMGELEEHKAALLSDLDKTSNAREAARRLRTLNAIYNDDKEISAIRSNRESFLTADEEMRKRIDGDKYTQKDYEEWYFKTLGEYKDQGGVNFDRSKGQAQGIDTNLRGANLESEIQKLAMDAAKSSPEQVREMLSGYQDIGDGQMQQIQTLIKNKYLDPAYDTKGNLIHQGIATEIADVLRQSERYQNWVDESAEYSWYWNDRKDSSFAQNTVQSAMDNLRASKAYFTQVAENTNDPETKKEASTRATEMDQKINEFNSLYNESIANNAFGDFAKSVYKENQITNRLATTAHNWGDVYDMESLTVTPTTRQDPDYGRAKDNIKDIGEYEINTHSLTASRDTTPYVPGGGSTASETQNAFTPAQWGNQQEFVRDINRPLPDDMAPENAIMRETLARAEKNRAKYGKRVSDDGKRIWNKLGQNTQDAHSFYERTQKYRRESDKMETRLGEIDVELENTNLTYNERKALLGEQSTLRGDMIEQGIAREGEFFYLNTLIDEEVAKTNPDGTRMYPWMQEIIDNDDIPADEKYEHILKGLYEKNLGRMDEVSNYAYGDGSGKGTAVPPLFSSDFGEFTSGSSRTLVSFTDSEGQTVERMLHKMEADRWVEANKINPDSYPNLKVTYSPTAEQVDAAHTRWTERREATEGAIAPDLFNKWRKAMMETETAFPTEVTVDDAAGKYTQGELKRIQDFITNQKPNTSGAPLTVHFDPGTGEAKPYRNTVANRALEYNIENYGTPDYVGTSQVPNGMGGMTQSIIMRYNMARIDAKERDKQIRSKYNIADDQAIPDNYKEAWKVDNPRELYVAVDNSSYNVDGRALNTFVSKGKDIIRVGGPDAVRNFSTMLDGFAAINLLSNNARRTDYGEMTTTLKQALKTGNENLPVYQGPAAWHDNGNETYSGYAIEYHYDPEENGIVADIKMITRGKGIPVNSPKEEYVATRIMRSINPQTIRAMDIFYGVGSERDAVKMDENSEEDFIPAFYNPEFAKRTF
jgi:hypothetical protein